MIKRYYSDFGEMRTGSDGDWVTYDDHAAANH